MDQQLPGQDDPSSNGRIVALVTRISTWFGRGVQLLPAGVSDGGPSDAATGDGADEVFLTDEERVRRHLREDGPLRQSELVDRTDWSKAKVSRLLSAMEEADQVSRTQIGREKIVALPESSAEATDATFDSDEDDSRAVAW